MGNKCNARKRRKTMSRTEVIEIDDACSSPDESGTPLRPIFCLKNRDDIKKYDGQEECFILDFDPYNDLDFLRLPMTKDVDNADVELRVVAEKGPVACRDFPHPRNTCAKYPFDKASHDRHCELCYCYVCDLSAPCSKWKGYAGHCHAFSNEAWNAERELSRQRSMNKLHK